jgi:hypothetical protein
MELAELEEELLRLQEQVRVLTQKKAPEVFLSERDVARELGKRRDTIRKWKRAGKLKPVDMGGKHPVFLRADIDRIKAQGISVLQKKARSLGRPRTPKPPVERKPLAVSLALTYIDIRRAPKKLRDDLRSLPPEQVPPEIRRALGIPEPEPVAVTELPPEPTDSPLWIGVERDTR